MTAEEKIRTRVVVDESGCWNWQGSVDRKGYGRAKWGREQYVHRASFQIAKGPIPDGLQIDHLCRNRRCCNPDHLEAVTPAENTRRGISPMLARLRRHAKTHCDHGHAFTPENSYFDARGYRSCKACRTIRNEAWNELRRQRHGWNPRTPPTNRRSS